METTETTQGKERKVSDEKARSKNTVDKSSIISVGII